MISDDEVKLMEKEILGVLDKYCSTDYMEEETSFKKWKVRQHIVNFLHDYQYARNVHDRKNKTQ